MLRTLPLSVSGTREYNGISLPWLVTNQLSYELVKKKIVLNGSDLVRWIIKEMHSSWPGRKQTAMLWTSTEGHMARNCGQPLVANSQQEMGASVLEQQGAEFFQQPVSLQEDPEPDNTLISAWWEFEQRTQLTHIGFLTHGNCEIINLCCLSS